MAYTKHTLADVQTETIGDRTRIWQFVVILPGAAIGEDCNICSHCFIENDVRIGDRVTIKSGVQVWDGISIEDDAFIGPNVTFTNDLHPVSRNRDFVPLKTVIGKRASIGAGAVILPGLHIGEDATVGAGAVVTKNVSAGDVVMGNPATVFNGKAR